MTTPSTVIEQEFLTPDLIDEITPLAVANWTETGFTADAPLDINWQAYFSCQLAGALCLITARIDGDLVGYGAYIITPHMHCASIMQAVQTVLFVAPEYRRGAVGYRMIAESDKILAARGATVIMRQVSDKVDYSKLLYRLSYGETERTFLRRMN